jgi:hypothetical protein
MWPEDQAALDGLQTPETKNSTLPFHICLTAQKIMKIYHNHARDIICDMSQALGFIGHKEVIVFP